MTAISETKVQEIKLGKIFYSVSVDEETGKVSVEEWHVITVRGKYAYVVWKIDGITYGKKSKKAGDFGWLRPVPPWTRQKLSRFVDSSSILTPSRFGLFPTKLSALKDELKTQSPRFFDDPEVFEKAARTLKSMITKERK